MTENKINELIELFADCEIVGISMAKTISVSTLYTVEVIPKAPIDNTNPEKPIEFNAMFRPDSRFDCNNCRKYQYLNNEYFVCTGNELPISRIPKKGQCEIKNK